jgi:hypothetical protein
MLLALVAAGCGGTATKTLTRTETVTETVTRTETVVKFRAPAPMVFVPQGDELAYKPDSLIMGAHPGPYNIRWKSYGGPTAVGRGLFASNDCTPSCAEGTQTVHKITVKLTELIACRGGLPAYTFAAIEAPGFDDEPYDLRNNSLNNPPC